LERWRRWLIEDARGWDESGEAGTISYNERDLRWFVDPDSGKISPVLLFVGRFLDVKRVPLLIRAYAAARSRFRTPAPLVIWGGFPGEWEGEHPYVVANEVGADGIFFTGWRGHNHLPEGLACADVMVGPSIKEGFGQVFIEAMACAVPVIVARSGGPLSFVNTSPGEPNGWLVAPDDRDGLADALVAAVNDPDARRERAENAYRQIRVAYTWDSLAERFAALYEGVARTRENLPKPA
jgi:glycosyltransferase involved in cell wall biosynthesis